MDEFILYLFYIILPKIDVRLEQIELPSDLIQQFQIKQC